MTTTELHYALALQNVSNIGDITAKKLIQHCGSVEGVFKAKKRHLLKIDGIGRFMLNDLFHKRHLIEAEQELKFIRSNEVTVSYYQDAHYPERLKHCIDGPILLFQRGQIRLENHYVISVVGTRRVTTHGITFCRKLIEDLKPYNPVIVSGFAYGTDITAQKTALEHNLQTIGCLAHGLNQVYPKEHESYCDAIERHGGFMTDFWSTTIFDRNNFLKRNRIIAGLSEATIVIESAEKGGSLVTADIANSYNREVFAVPGRPKDSQSIGCNNLIKLQRAHLLSEPADIPFILNWRLEEQAPSLQKTLFVELNEEEQIIYDVLNEHGRLLLDGIAIKSTLPTFKVAAILLNLELKGLVKPLPGKQFELF